MNVVLNAIKTPYLVDLSAKLLHQTHKDRLENFNHSPKEYFKQSLKFYYNGQ